MIHFEFKRESGKTIWPPGERNAMQRYIDKLPDGEYLLQQPKRKRNNRTLAQNRLLWKRHAILSEVTGFTTEEMHAVCLENIGRGEYVMPDFAEHPLFRRESSTQLNTKEFGELISEQQRIADILNEDLAASDKIILPQSDEERYSEIEAQRNRPTTIYQEMNND